MKNSFFKVLIIFCSFFMCLNTISAKTINSKEYEKQNTTGEIIQKRIIIGDQRAIDLKNSIDENEYDKWITSPTGDLEWLKKVLYEEQLVVFPNVKERTAVIVFMGIDDFRRNKSEEYSKYLNDVSKTILTNKEISLHYVSLTPVNDNFTTGDIKNKKIKEFNKKMKSKLSKNIFFIDAYTKNTNPDRNYSPWGDADYSDDGLYYDSDTNAAVYNYIMQEVYQTSNEVYDPHINETVYSDASKSTAKLGTKKLSLGVNQTYKFTIKYTGKTASSVNWSSGKKSVVTVNKKGKIKAIKKGTARITAEVKYNDGSSKKLRCMVTVVDKKTISKIVIKGFKTVKPKKSKKLIVKVTPSDFNEKITWKLNKKDIVKADCSSNKTCKIEGLKVGTVILSATSESGVTTKFPINVTKARVVKPKTNKKDDKIHFINVGSGDAILFESQGKYGLIDAGAFNKGSSLAVKYLLNNGITHLDFVIVTHGDGDHRGGIKEVLNTYSYSNKKNLKNDNRTYLVDKNTVFIYKRTKDLLYSKHKQYKEYTNTYKALMSISKTDRKPYIVESVATLKKNLTLEERNLQLHFRKTEIEDNSYIYFVMNNMTFRTYNLDNLIFTGAEDINNENTRSLVTLIEIKSGSKKYKVLSMGDANTLGGVEQYYGKLIGQVDVLKLGHHGYSGSNSREFLDLTKPSYAVISNGKDLFGKKYSFQVPMVYLTKVLNAKVYQTGDFTGAFRMKFESNKITINHGDKKKTTTDLSKLPNGTYKWREWRTNTDGIVTNIDDKNKVVTCMYYIRNKNIVKGEYVLDPGDPTNTRYYYYNESGRRTYTNSDYKGYFDYTMTSAYKAKTNCSASWGYDGNGKYFVNCKGNRPTNKISTIGNKKYYFNAFGYVSSGWKKIDKKLYYFDSNGIMQTGWVKSDDIKYYLDPKTGAAVTGEQEIGGKKYSFNNKGECTSCKK